MSVAEEAVVVDQQIQERRELILTAAATCIARQGYDGVRLRDISREAGVSIGLVQHYFDTREGLLAHAIRHLSEGLLADFAQGVKHATSAWGTIEALVEMLCRVPNLQEHSTMWVAFAGAVSRHSELAPHLENVYLTWDRYVRNAVLQGTQRGEFDPVGDVDDVVAVFLAFFDGYEYDMATGLTQVDADELRRRARLLATALLRPILVAAAS